jgi:putative transposase
MYGCQQDLIKTDKRTKAILEFICSESNKLANCAIYLARQTYFKTGKFLGKYDYYYLLKNNPHYTSLSSQAASNTLLSVHESFKSYLGLLKGIKKGSVRQKPKLPNYRSKDGLNVLTYPSTSVRHIDNRLVFPLGRRVLIWFQIKNFSIKFPTNLDYKSIKEYKIIPKNGQFYIEYVYKLDCVKVDLNPNIVLGIDHGIDNWLTCVSNVGTSFIIDGLKLKSLSQWYNKQVSRLKTFQKPAFWSKQLDRITGKRNRQVRDAVNKAARIVINHCISNRIGSVVFGWNKGQKQNANMGAKINQTFVQIPTGRLKERIKQLCEQHGIRFIETEESYTSKASFLDNDELATFGEKPEGWKSSGKRIKRGLFRSADGTLINADCNGAANILRKVTTTEGFDLSGVSRGAMATPLRIGLFNS